MQKCKTVAVVVNYCAARLGVEAVRSIIESDSLGPVRIAVVDNSQDMNEAAILQDELPDSVHLTINQRNEGFARACNLAFHQHDADMILLLNPDARLLPGALVHLQQSLLKFNRAGAVGPQIYWNVNKQFYLPPSAVPELLWFHSLISAYPPLEKMISRIWRRFAIRVWQSTKPVRVRNLSGGHVLLNRHAVMAAGGLFDPRFFLYYEDTDLFVRLRQAGYHLYIDPAAEVVHFYDQCGSFEPDFKRNLMAQSYELFMEKYSCGWKSEMTKFMQRWNLKPSRTIPAFNMKSDPFEIPVPHSIRRRWLFEWSPNSNFIPASGHFGLGDTMRFPMECWHLLAPGQYYGRLGKASGMTGTFEHLSWIKESINAC